MNIEHLTRIEELAAFLTGSQAIAFCVASSKDERYTFVKKTLRKFGYKALKRHDKGILTRFLCKVSGYSRQQMTRLIGQYCRTGQLIRRQKTVNGFKKKYTDNDIRLLAEMDERFETPNGAAIKKLCERAHQIHHEDAYKNLSAISVSHLYNLRRSSGYLKRRRVFEKTKPKQSSIGERRKPYANGVPGHIRIDTVHQGDLDGRKGVYHINAVDEVTQFEVVVSVEKISERYLIPALATLLTTFPFMINNFHSDNGSEYVNQHVAKLLKKLLIEFTKSRPRHSNDNALAECKNAAIIRKTFGYMHIPQRWAQRINQFNTHFLNPFINYHRPCYFPMTVIDKKGKEVKQYRYEEMMTPYEKLKSLPNIAACLKPGMTLNDLDKTANRISDNKAADQLLAARKALFREIYEQNKQFA